MVDLKKKKKKKKGKRKKKKKKKKYFSKEIKGTLAKGSRVG